MTINNDDFEEKIITKEYSFDDVTDIFQCPKVEISKEFGIKFNLTNQEVMFIEQCAQQWNIPYENAVAKIIHKAIDHLIQLYDIAQISIKNEK